MPRLPLEKMRLLTMALPVPEETRNFRFCPHSEEQSCCRWWWIAPLPIRLLLVMTKTPVERHCQLTRCQQASVPIRLPTSVLTAKQSVAAPRKATPESKFPEMTLPSPVCSPPMVFAARGIASLDAVGAIGNGGQSGGIRADQVARHGVVVRTAVDDCDAELPFLLPEITLPAPGTDPPTVFDVRPGRRRTRSCPPRIARAPRCRRDWCRCRAPARCCRSCRFG